MSENTADNTTASSKSSFYDLKAEFPAGSDVTASADNGSNLYDFSKLKGKVVLVVNTASKCGFTPQYKGLEALYQKFKDQDFEIIGFPSNQFAGQEPGTDNDIASFCEMNYNLTFPLMKKSDVNGDNANEVFKWLKNEKPGLLGIKGIKWNFEKFLIDKNGNVVERWASTTTPEKIEPRIEALLKQ